MQTIQIDLERNTILPLVYMKQRDVGAKILIIVMKNGTEFPIPPDTSLSVWFSGASGDGNYTDIDTKSAFAVQGNSITVEFICQMLNRPGEHMMCLVMNDSSGKQTGLWNIPYYVEEIPGADSEGAKQYYQAFLNAQEAAEKAAIAATEAAERAESVQAGNALLFEPQALTQQQQAQARENIGAPAAEDCVQYETKSGNNLLDESEAVHGSMWNGTTGDGLVSNQYTGNYYACSVSVPNGVSDITVSYVKYLDMANPSIYNYFEVYKDGTISDPIRPGNQYAETHNIAISGNTVEVRLNINSPNLLLADFNIMVNEGTEVMPYEPYENGVVIPGITEKLEKIEALEENCVTFELAKSTNLIDESTAVHGSWWTKTGLVSNAYTGHYRAYEVEVVGLTNIFITWSRFESTSASPCFYNYFWVYEDGTSSDAVVLQTFSPKALEVPAGAVKCRFNLQQATGDYYAQVNEGTEELPYEPYYERKVVPGISELENRCDRIEAQVEAISGTSGIVLGKTIHAVVGDTLQIFYDSIFGGSAENLRIMFQCAKGKNYPRYWEYTPAAGDVGSYPVTIRLLDSVGGVIAEKMCDLVVVAAKNPTSRVHVLCVGDSTMQNGKIPIEASRRMKGTAGTATAPAALALNNISFVGRIPNAEGTVGWEGTGGWVYGSYNISGYAAIRFTVSGGTNLNIGTVYKAGNFKLQVAEINVTNGVGNIRCLFHHETPYTSAFDSIGQSGTLTVFSGEGQSTLAYSAWTKENYQPFWDIDANKWNITKYRDTYCGGHIDVVCILLGINSVIVTSPFAVNATNDAKTLLRNIHSQLPNCKIIVSTLPPVSSNGGIAANYGASSEIGAYSANVKNLQVARFNRALIEMAESAEFSSYVIVSNSHAQFDGENGYPTTAKALNTRTTTTETLQSNGVHPNDSGYWQLSDALAFRACLYAINKQ